jgi:hypothetical protein
MGRVLANAVLDDAQVDVSAALLGVLSRLDAPHFHYLGVLRRFEAARHGLFAVPDTPEPYRSALDREALVTSTGDHGDVDTDHGRGGPNGLSAFGFELVGWLDRSGDGTTQASRPGR